MVDSRTVSHSMDSDSMPTVPSSPPLSPSLRDTKARKSRQLDSCELSRCCTGPGEV